jgi:hypothetical protein
MCAMVDYDIYFWKGRVKCSLCKFLLLQIICLFKISMQYLLIFFIKIFLFIVFHDMTYHTLPHANMTFISWVLFWTINILQREDFSQKFQSYKLLLLKNDKLFIKKFKIIVIQVCNGPAATNLPAHSKLKTCYWDFVYPMDLWYLEAPNFWNLYIPREKFEYKTEIQIYISLSNFSVMIRSWI